MPQKLRGIPFLRKSPASRRAFPSLFSSGGVLRVRSSGALSRVKVAPGKTVPPEHGVQHVLVGFGVQRVRREELVQLDAEGVFQRFQRSNDGFLCRVNVLAADALLFKGGVVVRLLSELDVVTPKAR